MAGVLLGCSGPGAGAAIHESIVVGYTHAAVVGVLLAASVGVLTLDRRWSATAVLAGLLALHPAWVVGARVGDCGLLKQDVARVFTGVGCAVLGWQIGRAVWLRQWVRA